MQSWRRGASGPKAFKLLGVAFFTIVLLSGCNSLFYYPSANVYVDPSKLPYKPKNVRIDTSDGEVLHGWFFRSPKSPPRATLLLFHGNAQNLTSHFYSLYWSIEEGFDYLIFDYRGYGLSSGEPSPEGTVRDGEAALKWLNAHKAPGSPVILFGQSLGGAIALKVACRTEEPYQKIVVDSTFHSYRSVARKVLSKSWLTWPFQWAGWLAMSDAHAPESCVDLIAPRPLLVVHGTNDRVVDFELGQSVYALARDPKEFWKVENGEHTDFLFRDPQYRARLKDWILKAN